MIESWDEKCRRAWCRFHGDKRTREQVAAEFNVKPGTLGAMLDRGRALSQSPLLAGDASRRQAEDRAREDDREEQLRRFRRRYAERRTASAEAGE